MTSAMAGSHQSEEERRRAERVAVINRIGALITGNLSLDELLPLAVEALAEHLHYHTIAVMVVDPDDPELLVLRTRAGIYESSNLGAYRQSIKAGIAGAAARSRRPLLVNDVRSDPRYIPVPAGDALVAELAIPLVVGERLLGLLNIESEQPISEEDAADFEIVAVQIAIAIENARLFEEQRRTAADLTTLLEVSRRVATTLELEPLLGQILDQLKRVVDYSSAAVITREGDQFTAREYRGPLPRASVLAQPQPIPYAWAAFERGEAVIVPDTLQDTAIAQAYWDAHREDWLRISAGSQRSLLGAPLVSAGQAIGILVLSHETPAYYSEHHAALALAFAAQAAAAIQNARLFEESRATLAETRLLYETSRRIGVALGVDEVVQAYLAQVAARGRYRCHVVLYEFDDAGERSAVVVWGAWSPERGIVLDRQRLALSRDAFDAELDAGRTVTIADYRTDARVSDEFRRTQEPRDPPPSLAMIPLMAGGERIGLVILSGDAVRGWQDADLDPYQVTAAQLAAVIDNRRQHDLVAARGQQLAVLEERQRLARELHDAVIQSVFSVSLIAQSILPTLRRDRAEAERRIDRLIAQSQAAVREMRAVVTELRPAGPPAHGGPTDGLAATLGRLATGLTDHGIAVEVDTAAYVPQAVTHERALQRIAQEALSNVVKHAAARQVTVRLAAGPETVRLTIADDGAGFPPAAGSVQVAGGDARSGGIGMTSMHERAHELGGRLHVRSQAGDGTTVEVELPRRDGGV